MRLYSFHSVLLFYIMIAYATLLYMSLQFTSLITSQPSPSFYIPLFSPCCSVPSNLIFYQPVLVVQSAFSSPFSSPFLLFRLLPLYRLLSPQAVPLHQVTSCFINLFSLYSQRPPPPPLSLLPFSFSSTSSSCYSYFSASSSSFQSYFFPSSASSFSTFCTFYLFSLPPSPSSYSSFSPCSS